jgi:hypothetical protein
MECRLCKFRTSTFQCYSQHYSLHSSSNVIPCGIADCESQFKTLGAFKVHITRKHSNLRKATMKCSPHSIMPGVCTVETCGRQFTLDQLIPHLKEHLKKKEVIACPYQQCGRQYSLISSFTAHISRCHYTSLNVATSSVVTENTGMPLHDDTNAANDSDIITSDVASPENYDNCDFPTNEIHHNMASFFLKMQCQHHVPATTVQFIAEEIHNIHQMSIRRMQCAILDSLSSNVSGDILNTVLQSVIQNDPVNLALEKENGLLRSIYLRKEYYRKKMEYITPLKICLGLHQSAECFAYYVPIKSTLQNLCMHNSVMQSVNTKRNVRDSLVYGDYFDGEEFRSNKYFNSHGTALHIILFQDAFEIVNPLGASKKKHKILATYMVLGNLESSLNNICLVHLCREEDAKIFPQEVLFRELLTDLKDLEINGITIGSSVYTGGVIAFLADNLGAHILGGFTIAFSSKKGYICRFCLLIAEDLQKLPYDATIRTPESYSIGVNHINTHPEELSYNGIKFNCIFNDLLSYHVCSPGLPACLAHDIFEGIVPYDVALILKVLIKKGCFTNIYLNHALKKFPFKGDDAKDRPPSVADNCKKLNGHAVQNWMMLRFLPLILVEKAPDCYDEDVWQLLLLLRCICELCCAPKISLSQVLYLQHLIDEYLENRQKLFPNVPLRPKHHYLFHYPWLILKLGPPIRLWTLRMESKHVFFKKCARSAHNFINVCLHLAETHQLFQCYVGDSGRFTSMCDLGSSTFAYDVSLFSSHVSDALSFVLDTSKSIFCSFTMKYKGTLYLKDQFVVVNRKECILEIGRILVCIHAEGKAYLVLTLQETGFHTGLGVWEVHNATNDTTLCIEVDGLVDYCPLWGYAARGETRIVMKHSIFDA